MMSPSGVALAASLALPMLSRQSDEHVTIKHDVEWNGI
jgi:hypothetical protein